MSIFRVEKNKNYTVISNYHLRDKNLSLRTIGLLSLILSLPDNWDYSQAGLVAICKDGEDSVRSGLKELEKFGYLKRERERDECGRVRGIIYHIYEVPEKRITENPKWENPIQEEHHVENQIWEQPVEDEPTSDKRSEINKEKQTKEEQNKNQSINLQDGQTGRQSTVDRKQAEQIIRKNIGYDFFNYKYNTLNEKLSNGTITMDEYEEGTATYNIKTVNQIVSYMLDIICSINNEPIMIGGDLIDRGVVRHKLLSVGMQEIKRVVWEINNSVIKNPKKYAISMLYNS